MGVHKAAELCASCSKAGCRAFRRRGKWRAWRQVSSAICARRELRSRGGGVGWQSARHGTQERGAEKDGLAIYIQYVTVRRGGVQNRTGRERWRHRRVRKRMNNDMKLVPSLTGTTCRRIASGGSANRTQGRALVIQFLASPTHGVGLVCVCAFCALPLARRCAVRVLGRSIKKPRARGNARRLQTHGSASASSANTSP